MAVTLCSCCISTFLVLIISYSLNIARIPRVEVRAAQKIFQAAIALPVPGFERLHRRGVSARQRATPNAAKSPAQHSS